MCLQAKVGKFDDLEKSLRRIRGSDADISVEIAQIQVFTPNSADQNKLLTTRFPQPPVKYNDILLSLLIRLILFLCAKYEVQIHFDKYGEHWLPLSNKTSEINTSFNLK